MGYSYKFIIMHLGSALFSSRHHFIVLRSLLVIVTQPLGTYLIWAFLWWLRITQLYILQFDKALGHIIVEKLQLCCVAFWLCFEHLYGFEFYLGEFDLLAWFTITPWWWYYFKYKQNTDFWNLIACSPMRGWDCYFGFANCDSFFLYSDWWHTIGGVMMFSPHYANLRTIYWTFWRFGNSLDPYGSFLEFKGAACGDMLLTIF